MVNQSNPTVDELAAAGKMLDEKKLPADLVVNLDQIDSVTLRRLVEEVRLEKTRPGPHYYDRVHNRHARS